MKFLWDKFNDQFAIIVLFLIVALWILGGIGTIQLPSEVSGALIVAFTLVIQFYFRKAQDESK